MEENYQWSIGRICIWACAAEHIC